jgi:hypothetical protein
MLEVEFPPINYTAIADYLKIQYPAIEDKVSITTPFFTSPAMDTIAVTINGQNFECDIWDARPESLLFQSSFIYRPAWDVIREPGFWTFLSSGTDEEVDIQAELSEVFGIPLDTLSVEQSSIMLSSESNNFFTILIGEREGEIEVKVITDYFEIPGEVAYRENAPRPHLRSVK